MKTEKGIIVANIVEVLLDDNKDLAKSILISEYPHKTYDVEKRNIQ